MKRPYVLQCPDGRFAVRFIGPDGRIRTLRCADDSAGAYRVRDHIVHLLDARRSRMPLRPAQMAWVEVLQPREREKFIKWGLLDGIVLASDDSIAVYIDQFLEHLSARRTDGVSPHRLTDVRRAMADFADAAWSAYAI
jgi:hypothetical protein